MVENYTGKIVLAAREPYEDEYMGTYLSIPQKKLVRAYIVLEDLGEVLLTAKLKCFKGEILRGGLFKKDYPNLVGNVKPNLGIFILPKENVMSVIVDRINVEDFDRIVLYLKKNIVSKRLNIITRQALNDFYNRYYKKRLKVGSVVTVIDSNRGVYYIKEKFDCHFIGVRLHYDYRTGLSVTDEEVVIPCVSSFVSSFYSEELKKKIESLIGEHKLKLTEGN